MKKILFVFLILLLAACSQKNPQFNSVDITGAGYAKDFKLTDHNGKVRTMADFNGKIVALFFGFTHCPDVCPTTMADMARVMTKLGDDAKKVQVLFVTLDPKRDTSELLAQYVPGFHPSFLGLTGDEATMKKTAKDFKIYAQQVEGETKDSYTIDHTAGMFVFDPSGRLRLFVSYGMTPDKITADVKTLLNK
ncbi:MAG: SCO family protein [Burkholderiales bacterium]